MAQVPFAMPESARPKRPLSPPKGEGSKSDASSRLKQVSFTDALTEISRAKTKSQFLNAWIVLAPQMRDLPFKDEESYTAEQIKAISVVVDAANRLDKGLYDFLREQLLLMPNLLPKPSAPESAAAAAMQKD